MCLNVKVRKVGCVWAMKGEKEERKLCTLERAITPSQFSSILGVCLFLAHYSHSLFSSPYLAQLILFSFIRHSQYFFPLPSTANTFFHPLLSATSPLSFNFIISYTAIPFFPFTLHGSFFPLFVMHHGHFFRIHLAYLLFFSLITKSFSFCSPSSGFPSIPIINLLLYLNFNSFKGRDTGWSSEATRQTSRQTFTSLNHYYCLVSTIHPLVCNYLFQLIFNESVYWQLYQPVSISNFINYFLTVRKSFSSVFIINTPTFFYCLCFGFSIILRFSYL